MARHEGLHPMRVSRADKALIQFACDVNRTTDDDYFSEVLLQDIDRKNINVVNVMQDIIDDVFNKRHQRSQPFCVNRLATTNSTILNQVDIGNRT